jgi:glycopeptide antibiotics resistance protein
MTTMLLAVHHMHLRWIIPISRWTLLSGAVLLAATLLSWRGLARRLGWRPIATLVALLGLAAALALTLSPRDWLANHRSLHQCLPSDWSELAGSAMRVGSSVESVLNISMLMPLGIGLAVASRRAWWPALLVVVLPAAIEITQVIIPGRECSAADWIANALGGLIGVAVGVLVDRRLRAAELAADQRAALTSS